MALSTEIAGATTRLAGEHLTTLKAAVQPRDAWADALYAYVPTTEFTVRLFPDPLELENPKLEMDVWLEASSDGVTWVEVARASGWHGGIRSLKTGALCLPSIRWSATGWAKSTPLVRAGWSQNLAAMCRVDLFEDERIYTLDNHHSIAHDAASSALSDSASSLTWSHTCSGSDRYLTVYGIQDDTTLTTITATYNGVSMGSLARKDSATWLKTEMFGLVAPATGAHNVVVNFNTSTTASSGSANSFTGVDATTPTGTVASANGVSTAPSVNVSSAAGELVVDGVAADDNCSGWSLTVGAGQTSRINTHTASSCGHGLGASTEAGAASVTMSWTWGGSVDWAIVGVPLKPATTSPTSTGAGTFPKLTGSATATQTQSATAAGTFPSFVGSAVGTQTHTATAAGTFPTFVGAATGTHTAGSGITGDGAGTFPTFVGAATGTQTHTSTATGTFPSFVGAATATQTFTSTAAGTFPSLTSAAVGAQTQASTAVGTFPVLVGSAAGTQGSIATAAGTFAALLGAAVGTQTQTATSAGVFPVFTGSAVGAMLPRAVGAGVFPALVGLAAASGGPLVTQSPVLGRARYTSNLVARARYTAIARAAARYTTTINARGRVEKHP